MQVLRILHTIRVNQSVELIHLFDLYNLWLCVEILVYFGQPTQESTHPLWSRVIEIETLFPAVDPVLNMYLRGS